MRSVLQGELSECGLACLATVACHHGLNVDISSLRKRFLVSLKGTTLSQLIRYAGKLGFICRPVRLELDHLQQLKLPCILHWNFTHYVVLNATTRGKNPRFKIFDPSVGERAVGLEEFSASFTGVALELTPSPQFERGEDLAKVSIRSLVGKVHGIRRALLQAIALAGCLELFSIAMPLFNQLVLDHAIAYRDAGLLKALALGFGLVLFTQNAISFGRGWLLMRWSMSISLQWTSRLFAHLLHLPLAYFERRQLGDISSRFGSLHAIQQILTGIFLESALDSLMAFAAFGVMYFYSPTLTAIVVLAMTAYALLRWRLNIPLRDAMAKGLALAGKESSYFLESLRAITALHLFQKTHQRIAIWQSLRIEVQSQNVRAEKLGIAYKTTHSLVIGTQGILLFYFGGKEVINGAMTIGMMIAFTTYAVTFGSRITNLIDMIGDAKIIRVHLDRLSDIVLEEPVQTDDVPPRDSRFFKIELNNVGFRYAESEPWILRDLNFTLNEGESVAITGASGIGKSTLSKILLGLERPTVGEILIDGIPISAFGYDNYRAMVGAVLQDDSLLSGSLADNISFFDFELSMPRMRTAAELAAIAADIEAMPMGYDSLIGEAGTLLSGGQKQRVLLARALYRQPQLLVLDEASSHLDVKAEAQININLANLPLTKIVVAHRAETIALCTSAYVLSGGKLTQLPPTSFQSNDLKWSECETS